MVEIGRDDSFYKFEESIVSCAEILLTAVLAASILTSNHFRNCIDVHPFQTLVKGYFLIAILYHQYDFG
jgi:hypothetical protein